MANSMSEITDLAIQAAKEAGVAILSEYRKKLTIEAKIDGSPLTIADQKAHHAILERLAASEITFVSEEGDSLHMAASHYWLVDPLDGTKDFLAGNDEFTVNIALIGEQAPVFGVLYAPALNELYMGGRKFRTWKEKDGVRQPCSNAQRFPRCRMAVSRFHDHPDVDLFAEMNQIEDRIAVGSALKYGRLGSSSVDVVPRLVGSSEWDTAAGQAVLEGAGGKLLDWHTGESLRYGKPKRRNPRLLAFRDPYVFRDFKLKTYEPELL